MEIVIPSTKKVDVKIVSLHVKVCDSGNYDLKDAMGNIVASRSDYVPSIFPGDHYGDYLILDIDIDTGMILNWKKPTSEKILKDFLIEQST